MARGRTKSLERGIQGTVFMAYYISKSYETGVMTEESDTELGAKMMEK